MVYEDGEVERTIHVNHAKPAKFTAPDLPEIVPPPEASHPPLGYLPAGLARPRPPPAAAAPAGDSASSSAAASANQQPAPAAPAAPAENAMQPPATAPANQRPEPAPRPRRSPRLNPEPGHACAIKSPPENPPHHSYKTSRMARMYPLTVSYNECLGSRATSLSFANLRVVDLRNGQSQYLSTIKQLVDELPKTEDPSSRFALQGHIARPGQKRLRRSMRAAIWWLLPSDGIFRRASNSLQYFLTHQGRRVVLRGGDVAYSPYNTRINWIPDPAPTPPPSRDHGDLTSAAPSRDHGILPSGKENTPPQDTPRKLPRKLRPCRRREKQSGTTANHILPSRKAGKEKQCGSAANHNSPSREAGREKQPGPMASHNSPSREAGNQPGTSGSTGSAMRAPVKHPLTFLRPQHPQHPRLTANHNSGHRFDPDHSESGRLYKPARSSIQQDSALRSRRDSFSGSGLSSPALQRSHQDSFSGSPAGHSNRNVSLTDPIREGRIAGGLRPGPVQPIHELLVRTLGWTLTQPRLKLLHLTVLNGLPRSWTSLNRDGWILLAARNHPKGVDHDRPGATRSNDPGIALQRYTGPRSAHHTPDTGVNSALPLV